MRTRPFALAVFSVLSVVPCLLIAQKPGRQLVPKAPDYVEVVNEAKPIAPALEIKFVQALSLHEEAWTPFALRVNDAGAIHVFSGHETLRRDFRPGQGPDKSGFFDPEFLPNTRDRQLLALTKGSPQAVAGSQPPGWSDHRG
jgi:hypothetical protein